MNVWFLCYCVACVSLAGWMTAALNTNGRLAYVYGALAFVSAEAMAVGLPLLIVAAQAGMLGG